MPEEKNGPWRLVRRQEPSALLAHRVVGKVEVWVHDGARLWVLRALERTSDEPADLLWHVSVSKRDATPPLAADIDLVRRKFGMLEADERGGVTGLVRHLRLRADGIDDSSR